MSPKVENNRYITDDQYSITIYTDGFPGPSVRLSFKFDGPLEIKPGAQQSVTVTEIRRETIEKL